MSAALRTRSAVVVAASVCVAALAVVAEIWRRSGFDAADAGVAAFDLLTTDVVGFAFPAAYFRFVVRARDGEGRREAAVHAALVGVAALASDRYSAALGEAPSGSAAALGALTASYLLACRWAPKRRKVALLTSLVAGFVAAVVMASGWIVFALRLGSGAVGAVCAIQALPADEAAVPGGRRLAAAVGGFAVGGVVVPWAGEGAAKFLLPIAELQEAYGVIAEFVGEAALAGLCARLFFVTALCQVSLGYLGIEFIRRGQERKNALIYVGDGKVSAVGFSRLVGIYMLTAALPYMAQRTIMENVNGYVYGRFGKELERAVRLGAVFPRNADGHVGDTLLAAVKGSKHTVDSYTDSFNRVVDTCYTVVEHKLFAFPKLILLPGMLMKQPWLVVAVLPASVAMDIGRARLIASLTKRLEAMSREIQELAQRRSKIEQHDTMNEELIRRGGAGEFAEDKWRRLAVDIEGRTLRFHALASLRGFVNALYKQDFLLPAIEIILAWLLESKHMPSTDIWVYTRVVEDAIDFLLTRFRMDAQLATMKTNLDRLEDLSERLEAVRARGVATCSVDPVRKTLSIDGFEFARGTSVIRLDGIRLRAGRVYAVTGANGSGKSTLFGLLLSCGSRPTVLPAAMEIRELQLLQVPSDDIVEVGQQLYCPLFTKPLAWMLQRHLDGIDEQEIRRYEERIEALSARMNFHGETGSKGASGGIASDELHEEMDDWYSTLSGGQRVKVELIRKVFIRDTCPSVLLIDEAFAPLDPPSKAIIKEMMKEFCSNSLILAIYHADASESCLTGQGSFFDDNLHFANGTAGFRRCVDNAAGKTAIQQ